MIATDCDFNQIALAHGYGDCWFGNEQPTKIYAAPTTLESFRDWLVQTWPETEGRQYRQAVLEVMDKMPEGWLFLVNERMLEHPGCHKPLFVSRTGLAHVKGDKQ